MKKKIALFTDVLKENFDGVSITLHKILRDVPVDRFDFLIITPDPPENPEKIPFRIVQCKSFNLPIQKGYQVGYATKKATEVLDQFKPDLIHFTSPSLLGRFAIKYGQRNNLPILSIYHTHFPTYIKYHIGRMGDALFGPFIRRQMIWFYKSADLTLVPTNPMLGDLAKLGVSIDRMKIWGRAVDTSKFSPNFKDENLLKSWFLMAIGRCFS